MHVVFSFCSPLSSSSSFFFLSFFSPHYLVRNLQKLHNTRLKVTFNDGSVADQEREIEGLTTEITQVSCSLN